MEHQNPLNRYMATGRIRDCYNKPYEDVYQPGDIFTYQEFNNLVAKFIGDPNTWPNPELLDLDTLCIVRAVTRKPPKDVWMERLSSTHYFEPLLKVLAELPLDILIKYIDFEFSPTSRTHQLYIRARLKGDIP